MASFWGTSEMGNWTVVDYEWNNDSAKRQKMPKTIKMAFPFYQYSITPNNLVYVKLFIQYGLKHFLSLIGILNIQFQAGPNMS